MGGGILQLVAKGMEDLFLSGDPEITLFKTLYRKYSHFSLEDKELKFNSRPNFGRESICKIKHIGDLIHKIYIMVDLPDIDLFFTVLTRGGAKQLLSEFGITWDIIEDLDSPISDADMIVIGQLINDEIQRLEDVITSAENSLLILQDPGLDPGQLLSTDEYFDLLIEALIQEDPLEFIYAFTLAWKNDYVLGVPANSSENETLINSTSLQGDLYTRYLNEIILPDGTRYVDENFIFVSNLEFNNFVLSINEVGIGGRTYFQNKLDLIYEDDVTNEYKNLDAYKLFSDYFDRNTVILNSTTDVTDTQNALVSYIGINLIRVIELLKNIFENQALDFNFTNYKVYPLSGTIFTTSNNFENLSLNNPADGSVLYDNFTDKFDVAQVGDPTNPYSIYVQSFISPLHVANQSLFRNTSFTSFFNDVANTVNMWDSLKLSNIIAVKSPAISTEDTDLITNAYFLNCIPYFTAIDIPSASANYITDVMIVADANYATFQSIFNDALDTTKDAIHTNIEPYMLTDADIEKIVEYKNTLSNVDNKDILGFHSYLQHFDVDGTVYNLFDYIIKEFEKVATDTISNYNATAAILVLPLVSTTDEDALLQIINMFATDEASLLPFSQYASAGYTLFETTITPNPLANVGGPPKYIDAVSSIWGHLYRTMNDNYKNFYNNEVLLNSYFPDSLGQDAERIKLLSEQHFLQWMTPVTTGRGDIGYYEANSINPLTTANGEPATASVASIDTELTAITNAESRYTDNKLLLNMKNIIVSRQLYFFEMFSGIRLAPPTNVSENGIHDIIETTIRNDPTTYGVNFPVANLVSDIINNVKDDLELIPTFGVMDKYDREIGQQVPNINYQQAFDEFFFASPGYNPIGELKSLHTTRSPNAPGPPVGAIDQPEETTNFNNTVGNFTANIFFADITNINSNYLSFGNELNFINYLLDTVLQKSSLSPLLSQKGTTNQETYDNFVNYYNNLIIESQNLLNSIQGDPPETPSALFTLINTRRELGQRANFAWIEKLGLFMIDTISIYIDGELIDKHTGEYLYLWHEISKRKEKEHGYNNIIGHMEHLYRFDDVGKKGKRLHIPLEFWFCRHVGSSIPLIALTHADVDIRVKFKSLNQCAYWDSGSEFQKSPRLNASLLAQYIYVEPEERGRIVKSKHEYLIETIQYDTNFNIDPMNFEDTNTLAQRFYFKYPCKELIWGIREVSEVNGSRQNGELRWNVYTDKLYGEYPDTVTCSLRFNGRERQLDLPLEYYNFAIPYSYHTSVPDTGIFNYSFGLIPELLQPSGGANLSKVDHIDIVLELSDTVKNDIINNNRTFQWTTYIRNINVLRIMSGLAALAYYE